jgi:cell division septation protein DedD
MKTISKPNTLVLTAMTLSIFSVTGCISKTIEVRNNDEVKVKEEKSVWKSLDEKTKKKDFEPFPSFHVLKKSSTKVSKEDCKDCYVDILKPSSQEKKSSIEETPKKEKVYTYDPSNVPANTYKKKEDGGYEYKTSSANIYEKNPEEKEKASISSPNLATKVAIQIGAFRRYAGAKVYAKKYDLLSNQYGVKIETGVKDQKPLYRVKIEGFANKREALEFKDKYSLSGAFLVKK